MSIEQQLTAHLTAQADQIDAEPAWDDLSARTRRAPVNHRLIATTLGVASLLVAAAIVIPLARNGGQSVRTIAQPAASRLEPVDHRVTGDVEVLARGSDMGVDWEVFAFPTNLGPCYGARSSEPWRRPANPLIGFPAGSYVCPVGAMAAADAFAAIGISTEDPPPTIGVGGPDTTLSSRERLLRLTQLPLAAPVLVKRLAATVEAVEFSPAGGSTEALAVVHPTFDPSLRLAVVPPLPEGTSYIARERLAPSKVEGRVIEGTVPSWRDEFATVGGIRIVARSATSLLAVGATREGDVCVWLYAIGPQGNGAPELARLQGRWSGIQRANCHSGPPLPFSGSAGAGAVRAGTARVRVTFSNKMATESPTFGCDAGLPACFIGVTGAPDDDDPVRVDGYDSSGRRLFTYKDQSGKLTKVGSSVE